MAARLGCPRSHTSLLRSAPGACVRNLYGKTLTSYPVSYNGWFHCALIVIWAYLFGITGRILAKEALGGNNTDPLRDTLRVD